MENKKPWYDKSNESEPGKTRSRLAAHHEIGDVGDHWPISARAVAEELFLAIDALTAERDGARLDLARSQSRERDALRRGFEAALALDGNFQVKFPEFEHFEKHLAELEEDAAREIRIAEAEANE
jgi:hypothetical protein